MTRIWGRGRQFLVYILVLRIPGPGVLRRGRGREMQLRQAMTQNPHTVSLNGTAQEIAFLMANFGTSSIAVVHEGKPVGVVTEEDLVRKVVAKGLEPKRTPASELMNRRIIKVSEDSEIEEAVFEMRKNRSSEVLVCAPDGVLTGTFSLSDLACLWDFEALGEVVARLHHMRPVSGASERQSALILSPASS
jgi:CBS domain-containing protein